MINAAGKTTRVAVLYTSVFEAIKEVREDIREEMDLEVNARTVAGTLAAEGFEAWPHAFGKDVSELVAGLAVMKPDIVFNLSECPFLSPEKEMHACALLELLRLPYTGNGPLSLGICNSKSLTKKILLGEGVPTPPFRLYTSEPAADPDIPYPLVVKPANEDGSAGITEDSFVRNLGELRRQVKWLKEGFRQNAIAERFVGGREFNVGLLGNGTRGGPPPDAPPGRAGLQEPALAPVHLRIEVGQGAPLVPRDRPGVPGRGAAGAARPDVPDHPRVRPDLPAHRVCPRRFPHGRPGGPVRPRSEPQPRHLPGRRDDPRRARRRDPLHEPRPRDPAARARPGGALTRIRPIEAADREPIRELIAGTNAFKPFEVDVAMELVDVALTQKDQEDYHSLRPRGRRRHRRRLCLLREKPHDPGHVRPVLDRDAGGPVGKGYGREIVGFVVEEVRKMGGKLLVIETSSQESYGTTRRFYEKIGCTLAATLPDYYDEGDDKLIYLLPIR